MQAWSRYSHTVDGTPWPRELLPPTYRTWAVVTTESIGQQSISKHPARAWGGASGIIGAHRVFQSDCDIPSALKSKHPFTHCKMAVNQIVKVVTYPRMLLRKSGWARTVMIHECQMPILCRLEDPRIAEPLATYCGWYKLRASLPSPFLNSVHHTGNHDPNARKADG